MLSCRNIKKNVTFDFSFADRINAKTESLIIPGNNQKEVEIEIECILDQK